MSKSYKVGIFNYSKQYSKFIKSLKFNFKNYNNFTFFNEQKKSFLAIKSLIKKKKINICIICKINKRSFFASEINFLIKNKIKIVMAVSNKFIDIHGMIIPKPIKSINFDYLFLRKKLNVNKREILNIVKDKKILITGGAGSIGSTVLMSLLKFQPSKIAVLDNNEYSYFKLYNYKLKNKQRKKIKFYLSNIENYEILNNCLKNFKPEIVFHAAALKHVNFLENNITQACYTNVIGTENILKSSIENKVKYFVNISTDKAANPINILGRTKRVAEMQCLNSIKTNNTKICCVRFGNVYETNGSLTQLVTEKIYNNQKISINSPQAERYFMNKSEAAYLLLNSLIFLKNDNDIFNRKIYVSNMGLSININDLVRKIIFLNGRNIDDFISKKFYGLNKGEKIKEDLFNKTEIVTKKHSNKIFEIKYIYDKNFQLNYSNLKKSIHLNKVKVIAKNLKQLCQ
jgi:FlaA1/EpsC-like NDP-sugar epimerase